MPGLALPEGGAAEKKNDLSAAQMRLSNLEIEVYMGNFNPMYVTFGIYLIAVLLIGMAVGSDGPEPRGGGA